jgi:hypothetical protein
VTVPPAAFALPVDDVQCVVVVRLEVVKPTRSPLLTFEQEVPHGLGVVDKGLELPDPRIDAYRAPCCAAYAQKLFAYATSEYSIIPQMMSINAIRHKLYSIIACPRCRRRRSLRLFIGP